MFHAGLDPGAQMMSLESRFPAILISILINVAPFSNSVYGCTASSTHRVIFRKVQSDIRLCCLPENPEKAFSLSFYWL